MNGKHIKCMVWDLDQTIWNGILLEDDRISLKKPVIDIIKTCDERGILHSIASKNEYDLAVRKLKSFGLLDYFIYPQINWSAKSNSINTIADKLGFDLDTFMFIDDQPFEREQVRSVFPQVRCVDPDELNIWLDQPQLNPPQTHESQNRRIMYQAEEKRAKEEEKFVGPRESFLASLDMHLRISPVIRTDLERAEELCNRTNQLNTTGYSYSMDELNRFRQSQNHRLLIASLDHQIVSHVLSGDYTRGGYDFSEVYHQSGQTAGCTAAGRV